MLLPGSTQEEEEESFVIQAFAASSGKRDMEYAVVLAVDKPIPDAYVAALLQVGDRFNVLGTTDLNKALHGVAFHFHVMWGDVSGVLERRLYEDEERRAMCATLGLLVAQRYGLPQSQQGLRLVELDKPQKVA